MALPYKEINKMISQLGVDGVITAYYKLAQEASAGSFSLDLDDCQGIQSGRSFTIGSETLLVKSVGGLAISFDTPLASSYPAGTWIVFREETKLKEIPDFQRVQDQREWLRNYRIPKQTLINYGALIEIGLQKFYTVGIEDSLLSIQLRLREANATATIKTAQTTEVFNGFNYKKELSPSGVDVPVYIETLSSTELEQAPGWHPEARLYVLIPNRYPVKFGDQLSIGDNYKVVSIDNYRIRGIQFIQLAPDKVR